MGKKNGQYKGFTILVFSFSRVFVTPSQVLSDKLGGVAHMLIRSHHVSRPQIRDALRHLPNGKGLLLSVYAKREPEIVTDCALSYPRNDTDLLLFPSLLTFDSYVVFDTVCDASR